MKILMLDDDKDKPRELRRILIEDNFIETPLLHTSVDVNGAKEKLKNSNYDVLIVDLLLPSIWGETENIDAGINFVKDITTNLTIDKPKYIICLTRNSDSLSQLDMQLFSGIIEFEDNSDDWSDKILLRLQTYEKLCLNQRFNNKKYDLAILTALHNPELAALKNISDEWNQIEQQGTNSIYYEGKFVYDNKTIKYVACNQIEMGMAAAAYHTNEIISFFNPKVIFMSGIAAGMKDKVSFGDVVIADPSYDYGLGKIIATDEKTEFLPDPRQIRVNSIVTGAVTSLKNDTELLTKIRADYTASKPNTVLTIHQGHMASGAAVIANEDEFHRIEKYCRKLISIDMETYGVYFSAHNHHLKPIFASIKSISDFGDEQKDSAKYREYASYTSARIAKELAAILFEKLE
jgi:nucleoside phosphorylase